MKLFIFIIHSVIVLIHSNILSSKLSAASERVTSEVIEEKKAALINVKIKPIAILFKIPGLQIDLGITPRSSIGVSIDWMGSDTNTTRFNVYPMSVFYTYYFTPLRFGEGWLLRAGATYLPLEVSSTSLGRSIEASNSRFSTSFIGEYEWVWNSGFNIQLGGGLVLYKISQDLQVQPLTALQVGWCFGGSNSSTGGLTSNRGTRKSALGGT